MTGLTEMRTAVPPDSQKRTKITWLPHQNGAPEGVAEGIYTYDVTAEKLDEEGECNTQLEASWCIPSKRGGSWIWYHV